MSSPNSVEMKVVEGEPTTSNDVQHSPQTVQSVENSERTPSSDSIRTGSNKRKPKHVQRFVDLDTLDSENPENQNFDGNFDCIDIPTFSNILFSESLTSAMVESTTMPRKKPVARSPRFTQVIDLICKCSSVEEETRQRLKWALMDVHKQALTLEDACVQYHLATEYLNFYYDMAEKIWKKRKGSLEKLRGNVGTKVDKVGSRSEWPMEFVNGPPLDPTDKKRIEKIAYCVNKVCKNSTYSSTQKEKLRDAVLMVILGEASVYAAANKMQLPSSTMTPYVQRARALLGSTLPPQATAPPLLWPSNKRSHHRNELEAKQESTNSNLNKVDEVISSVVSDSDIEDKRKQHIYEALLLTLTGNMTVKEAARRYSLQANIIESYFERAAQVLKQMPQFPFNLNKKSDTNYTQNGGESSDYASEDEIRDAVSKVLANLAPNVRKEKISSAIIASVCGKLSIKDACQFVGLSASTVHPYVSKVRYILGTRCPPSRPNSQVSFPDESSSTVPDYETHIIQEILQSLCSEELIDESLEKFSLTRDELWKKIRKILAFYNYKEFPNEMCDAVIDAIYNPHNVEEIASSKNLPISSVIMYMRLLKVYLCAENLLSQERSMSMQNFKSDAKSDSPCESLLDVIQLELETPVSSQQDFNLNVYSDNTSSKRFMDSKHSKDDVMVLHSEEILNCEEKAFRMIINYLVKNQYKRTAKKQKAMRMSLENILLDGLSINEVLEVYEGMTDHILKVYVNRCRDVYKCLKVEYRKFTDELEKLVRKRSLAPDSNSSYPQNFKRTRFEDKINFENIPVDPVDQSSTGNAEVDCLNGFLSDSVLNPMDTYLRKLQAVNFPITDEILIGLAKRICRSGFIDISQISEETWSQWAEIYLDRSIGEVI